MDVDEKVEPFFGTPVKIADKSWNVESNVQRYSTSFDDVDVTRNTLTLSDHQSRCDPKREKRTLWYSRVRVVDCSREGPIVDPVC